MGRHFDGLVETVKIIRPGEAQIRGIDAKSFLIKLVNRSKLYEFPFTSEQIRPRSKKEITEYIEYLKTYFNLCESNGRNFVTPHSVTAIEDADSVVILANSGKRPTMVNFRSVEPNLLSLEQNVAFSQLFCGEVNISPPDQEGYIDVSPTILYGLERQGKSIISGQDYLRRVSENALKEDITTAIVAFIKQIAYIMSPANFIVEEQSLQSANQGDNKNKKKSRKAEERSMKKTVRRPVYRCVNHGELEDFMQEKSEEPVAIKAIAGYFKTLRSPVFKNMRGKVLLIEPYTKGEKVVIDRNGTRYSIVGSDYLLGANH